MPKGLIQQNDAILWKEFDDITAEDKTLSRINNDIGWNTSNTEREILTKNDDLIGWKNKTFGLNYILFTGNSLNAMTDPSFTIPQNANVGDICVLNLQTSSSNGRKLPSGFTSIYMTTYFILCYKILTAKDIGKTFATSTMGYSVISI